MAQYTLRTTNAVAVRRCHFELSVSVTLLARFSAANRLLRVEECFDAMALMQQLQQMGGPAATGSAHRQYSVND